MSPFLLFLFVWPALPIVDLFACGFCNECSLNKLKFRSLYGGDCGSGGRAGRSSNPKVTGLVPWLPWLHVKLSLSEILNPKFLISRLALYMAASAISVWMCVNVTSVVKRFVLSVRWKSAIEMQVHLPIHHLLMLESTFCGSVLRWKCAVIFFFLIWAVSGAAAGRCIQGFFQTVMNLNRYLIRYD